MGQPKGFVLLRVALVLALVAGLALLTRGVRAEGDDEDGDKPAVVIHGGNNSVVNNVTFDADGGEGNADSAGGDINTGSTSGGQVVDTSGGVVAEGDVASGGNGGVSASDASGGTLYSPTDGDGNPIPAVETGGNSGSQIAVGEIVGGDGNMSVEIYGGDMSIVTNSTVSVAGGIATTDASGGDANVATVFSGGVSGGVAEAGNGGVGSSSATGGNIPVGATMGGNNHGAVINVDAIVGGTGDGGDVDVKIHGGTLTAITSSETGARGGTAFSDVSGGDLNVSVILGAQAGDLAEGGNGGLATTSANGGVATIGAVDGPLYGTIGGNNYGANINLGTVKSGDSGGGDATVAIYGGDIFAAAGSVGGPAYAGGNVGADIDAGNVVAGDNVWGDGGDATLLIDAGSISASAAGPFGADAGDNLGSDIVVGNTTGGSGSGAGSATTIVEGSDIATFGVGFEIVAPPTPSATIQLPFDNPGASAGEGGLAVASANSGSARTGPVFAGDNVGTQIVVGDTRGGNGWDGGGDATVHVIGTDISTSFEANVAVDGGLANASALGGMDNIAQAPDAGFFTVGSAAAGSGGFAGASANGGNIVIGTIYVGGNHGGVINVGDTVGGGGHDASVTLDGGSIVAAVVLNLEALGGDAGASADGGDENVATLLGDGTADFDAFAGTGGIALANANGGYIQVGDILVGGNQGAVMKVGDTVAGWGGDATVSVEGTDILSVIQLDLQANGGLARASANGGDRNASTFDATNAAANLGAIDVLAGAGGYAEATATGGAIIVGDLIAGRNVGTVVNFGNTGPGEGKIRVGGPIASIVHIAAAANGGSAASVADGGDDNVAYLIADGTTLIGVPSAGNGGTAVSDASGGLVTIGNVTSGENVGAVFVEDRPNRGGGKPDGGKPGGGKPGGGKPGAGGKVKALPSTGAGGTVAGTSAASLALLLLGAVLGLTVVGFGLRRRVP